MFTRSGTMLIIQVMAAVRVLGLPHTEAVCNSQTSWSYNSLGQSPCLVAAYLGNICASNNAYDVPALTQSNQTYGPSPTPSKCECNSVEYSLYSMCAACQGATINTWTYWTTNCTNSTLSQDGVFPFPIPNGTAVPAWAFLTVEGLPDQKFDPAIAENDHNGVESVFQSSTSSGPSPTASALTSHKQSDAGAIAGGAVGGVILLASLAGIAFFVLRKRRKEAERAARQPEADAFIVPPSMGYKHAKPYNPDDPSTFPTESLTNLTSVRMTDTATPATSARYSPYANTPPI